VNSGNILHRQGKNKKALQYFKKAIAVVEKAEKHYNILKKRFL